MLIYEAKNPVFCNQIKFVFLIKTYTLNLKTIYNNKPYLSNKTKI